jgi:hypothetical protein
MSILVAEAVSLTSNKLDFSQRTFSSPVLRQRKQFVASISLSFVSQTSCMSAAYHSIQKDGIGLARWIPVATNPARDASN